MKRRSFMQLLSLIPLLPAKTLYADIDKSQLYRFGESSMETDSPQVFCNDPIRATKYISGLYRSVYERSDSSEYGFDETIKTAIIKEGRIDFYHPWQKSNSPNTAPHIPAPSYVISGEGKTKEEAWDNFWGNFEFQTVFQDQKDLDIFWRRVVEVEEPTTYPWPELKYRVACRFSLGDFT